MQGFRKTRILEPKNKLSIHSEESIAFATKYLLLTDWHKTTIKHGLHLPCLDKVPKYFEKNNFSSLTNAVFVETELKKLLEAGHISQVSDVPHCVSPLQVATKFDSLNNVHKLRLVLDLSRHVNEYVPDIHVKLDDLSYSEPWLFEGAFMTSFDLKSMFHQVGINTNYRTYFGFSYILNGEQAYFVYNVLPFGFKLAVWIVTHLILPLKLYIHTFSILFSIYLDDGRVIAKNIDIARYQTAFVIDVFQYAGWELNYAKSTLEPTQQLYYLGFYTDTVIMKYFSSIHRLQYCQNLISEIIDQDFVPARHLAKIVGIIASFKKSHSNIVNILTRRLQNTLALAVLEGEELNWNVSVPLNEHCKFELQFFLTNLVFLNGKHICVSKTSSQIFSLPGYELETRPNLDLDQDVDYRICCSDASESKVYIYEIEKFELVDDFVFEPTEIKYGSGHRELLGIVKALENRQQFFTQNQGKRFFWVTDSRNCEIFLTRGSAKFQIQQDIVKIKLKELELNIEIVPIWVPRTHNLIYYADLGSKIDLSTDEWHFDNVSYSHIKQFFGLEPSIDGMASNKNNRCHKFFSLIPFQETFGVDFFAQTLSKLEVYYICPPPTKIIFVMKHIMQFHDITSIVVVPRWRNSNFWPFITRNGYFAEFIHDFFIFYPTFFPGNEEINIFNGRKKFPMLALLVKSDGKKKLQIPKNIV